MMKKMLAAGVLFLAGPLQAATIDLTDGIFSDAVYETFVQGPIGPVIGFTETVDGVSFTFHRVSGQFRKVGPWGDGSFDTPPFALDFGGGGGSASSFSLVSSHDVTLDSFSGMGQQFNTAPVFDFVGGSVSSEGNAFSMSGFLGSDVPGTDPFADGPLSLDAGVSYVFTVTNNGAATRGYLTALTFTPVPLPAAFPVMLSALVAVSAFRRRM